MIEVKKPALAAFASGVLALTLATAAQAQEVRFEHVMNIGTEGTGPGQFKYVEDFAFSADGHLLVTDAAHAYVQVFDKTTGAYIDRFGGKGAFHFCGRGEHYIEPMSEMTGLTAVAMTQPHLNDMEVIYRSTVDRKIVCL